MTEKRADNPETPDLGERAEPEEDTRPELTVLVLLRDQLQRLRIAEGNRRSAAERLEEPGREAIHLRYEDALFQLEHDVEEQVRTEMRQHPAWPWLERIHGLGELSAALVIGLIDVERAATVSALWRYAGYGVTDGHRDRPTKGEKLPYNARLKTMVWRIIDLQVKHRGPYRVEYDNAKHTYMTTRADWTKGHVELASRRKAAKLFLSHLWQVWREALELPVRPPFIMEHGGPGHDMIDPWEYVEHRGAPKEPAPEEAMA